MENRGKSAFGLDPNVAAGLAYIPVCFCHLIVSIAIIASDKTNKLPRFHAFQSLLLSALMIIIYVVCIVIMVIIGVATAALNVPALGILVILIYGVMLVLLLAGFVGHVIGCINAFQGKIFKLPVIGNMADNWSN